MRTAKELDTCSGRLPGDVEDDMLGRIDRQKRGTARGSPRRSRTAKAAHISRRAMKLCCAHERGGWGRLSVDGSGQHNLNRSEDPWSRAIKSLAWRCSTEQVASDSERRVLCWRGGARRMDANLITRRARGAEVEPTGGQGSA